MSEFRKISKINLTAMKHAENNRKKFTDGLPNVTLTLPDECCLPSTLRVNFGFDWDSSSGSSKTVDFYPNFSKIADIFSIISNSVINQINNVFTLTNYVCTTVLLKFSDPGVFLTKNHNNFNKNIMRLIVDLFNT